MFIDRRDAGKQLAALLLEFKNHADQLILALPRGGVPVAYEVSKTLKTPMDIFIVRKLGLPWHEELAMGALTQDDITVLNQDVIQSYHVTQAEFDQVVEKEKIELQRRNILYRNNRPYPDITDKTIILIDDGIATGATIKAAIKAIKLLHSKQIIVACPVASPTTVNELRQLVDGVYCVAKPTYFMSIGQFYRNFNQTTDEEVQTIINKITASR